MKSICKECHAVLTDCWGSTPCCGSVSEIIDETPPTTDREDDLFQAACDYYNSHWKSDNNSVPEEPIIEAFHAGHEYRLYLATQPDKEKDLKLAEMRLKAKMELNLGFNLDKTKDIEQMASIFDVSEIAHKIANILLFDHPIIEHHHLVQLYLEGYLKGDKSGRSEERKEIVGVIEELRDELYEAIPTGKIDAFELIKVIKNHLIRMDERLIKQITEKV